MVPRFGTLTKVSQQCIEERIAGIVSDKRALFKGVFEGSSDQIDFERSSSFMSLLERLIEPPSVSAPTAAVETVDTAAADESETPAIATAACASRRLEPPLARSPRSLTGWRDC